jgi:two-component system, chemotaxis family, protein-glutamate methylesterase/glutaminase
MPIRDVVVVGASAGGVEALVELARGLPRDLPAAVFVVLHLPPDARSNLPSILDRAGSLPAVHAEEGAPIHPGRIYVAPPNRHLTLEGSRMRLSIGPRINSLRPSIDVLFRSAARAFDSRVVGVVLSGTLDDGSLGLDAIKLRGGVAIIQDPNEARFSGMPRSAVERVDADHVVPVAQIPVLLEMLTVGSAGEAPPVERGNAVVHETVSIAGRGGAAPPVWEAAPPVREKRANGASGLSCPNCRGSVWELTETDDSLPRIECRVGHAFSIDAFLGEQAVALEDAIWSAINALEERASTLRQFAARFAPSSRAKGSYLERAEMIQTQAGLLRDGLARVIQVEGNGGLGETVAATIDPGPIEGGPS